MWSTATQLPAAIATLTAATELTYITTPIANIPSAPFGVTIIASINVTGGATGGVWTLKLRRGVGVAGAQVGLTQSFTMPATTTTMIVAIFTDTAPTNGQYTLTVTAAGSAGVGNDGNVMVMDVVPYGSDI